MHSLHNSLLTVLLLQTSYSYEWNASRVLHDSASLLILACQKGGSLIPSEPNPLPNACLHPCVNCTSRLLGVHLTPWFLLILVPIYYTHGFWTWSVFIFFLTACMHEDSQLSSVVCCSCCPHKNHLTLRSRWMSEWPMLSRCQKWWKEMNLCL